MKKLFKKILILIVLFFLGYFIYVNYINGIPVLDTEEEKVSVSEYYIYGNHLNIKGTLDIKEKNYQSIDLILYNGKEKEINITTNNNDNQINFYTSDYINEGIYIDDLSKGTYYFFLRLTYDNKDNSEKPIKKYYVLNNKTTYNDITYYTLSKYNNKILLNFDNDYKTMALNVKQNEEAEIYDVTIDPGHGGIDSGAIEGNLKESDLTMAVSNLVKEELEKEGLKVKLTHEENELSSDEYFDEYNEHGRAVIPNEIKSKYTISIHFNTNSSSSVNGLEVYTADNINYDFAKSLVKNITTNTNLNYSNNKLHKINDGIYTHNFTQSEITSSLNSYKTKNYTPFNITTNSNYFYMIRETGGYLTGAYIDDSNPEKVGVNPYYNSNIGNETYLLELGYLTNDSDLEIIKTKQKELAKSISTSIIEEVSKK